MERKELVKMDNLVKIYGHHRALDSVSFDLMEGEVHCLVGENGAGKSTLIKILSGAISPEAGDIFIGGKTVGSLNPRQSIELGISTIYQDAELVDSLTVADNVFLGDEKAGRFPLIVDSHGQEKRVGEIIDTLKMNLPVNVLVEELSASQKQMLQIVKALYRDSKVLIMDEPTSSLGIDETQALMDIIRKLRQRGIGIIYISHYLEEIFEIGDRVTILKDGVDMGTYNVADIKVDEVIRKMVGRDASLFYKRNSVEIGDAQLEIRDFGKTGIVEDVTLSVRRGEIFGLGGLVGSGRSELVSLIFGAERPDRGEVVLNGRKLRIKSPGDAIRKGIALITEDRKKLAMLNGRDIVENSSLVHSENFKGFLLKNREERNLTNEIVNNLSVTVQDESQKIEELSGGNQQKIIIGRWLIDDSLVYIFDEPTKGVDIGAKEQIYELMTGLAKRGKSIIMISSDMPELLSMSDRIGVMRSGRLVEILDNAGIKEEDLIKRFIGVQ
ncbi:MAG TPA: sugar ABC transporter ATP-binding protein [Mesotoga sp.]|jgi:ribose transport system ATP-binding protein|nr:sugar ABC transporter ATP-binding protein [Mesotoga sp.]MDI9375349.1 sugar ABC transporter ATP-binding protein [Thermotogota bacterium]NLX33523.1 sugar ABC transporter ATP-binding protein [Thermotogaceae bacterium]MDD4041547.1 sugar ABC transporter ATP-binding protein [Mesotoga sp.]MDD4479118.1 sugar ABC transporter ATP-binding protein [Mesotoga sp.]